jgi:hypothetical protein
VLQAKRREKQLKDNYPKFVLTMDENWRDELDGIPAMHIADFLMMNPDKLQR